jgi:hypothetical protein
MSLEAITAKFECDECGKPFEASIDESYQPPPGWSMFDVAEDAIRGTVWETVNNGKHLCRACTAKDDASSEDSGR